jgi:hypothetical protein
MSVVWVVVMDCTEIGESLPTPTLPTLIWRVLRLGVKTGGALGNPKLIAGTLNRFFLMPSRHRYAISINGLVVMSLEPRD